MENRPKKQLSLKLGQRKLTFQPSLLKTSKSISEALSTIVQDKAPISNDPSHRLSEGDTPSDGDSKTDQNDRLLYSGLCNLGNTCYVNSVLQALRFCPKFSEGVTEMQSALESRCPGSHHGNGVNGQEGEEFDTSNTTLSSHLCKLWQRMAQKEKTVSRAANKTSNLSATKPDTFLAKLREDNQLFDNKLQHDAQELLRFLLTNLHETYMSIDPPDSPPPPTSTPSLPTHASPVSDGMTSEAPVLTQQKPITKVTGKKRKFSSLGKLTQPINKFLKLNSGKAKKKLDAYFSPDKNNSSSLSNGAGDDKITKSVPTTKKAHGRNFISQTFQGSIAYQTHCFECENTTRRTESFLDISVPVYHSGLPGFPPPASPMKTKSGEGSLDCSVVGPYSLSWCLSKFALREKLRGENKYECDECGRLTEAERSMLFGKLPNVMTIHLNRFTTQTWGLFSNIVVNKIGGNIAVPLALSFKPWTTEDCKGREKVYQLFAVVFHSGSSCMSGHYTACVRECVEATQLTPTQQDNKPIKTSSWLYFDDESVEVLSQSQFLSLLSPLSKNISAYILFYTCH